jgi:DNA-binding NarL/FixJ family response regulator
MSVVSPRGGYPAPRRVRVLVAAPNPSLTSGIAALVRDTGFTVVAERGRIEATSGLEAADVAVIAQRTVVAIEAFGSVPAGAVVIGCDRSLAELLARDGTRAVGVVPGDADATTIGAAISAVAAGLSVRPPDLTPFDWDADDALQPSARPTGGSQRAEESIAEPLTARERDVLDWLARGLSNRAIAARLGISEHTVKFHLASIFGKLGVRTRTAAVRRALRRGLIDL